MQISSFVADPLYILRLSPAYHITYPVTLQHYAVGSGDLFIFPIQPLANSHCSNIFTSVQTMFYLVNNSCDIAASDICKPCAGPFLHPEADIKAHSYPKCSLPPFHLLCSTPKVGVPAPTPINSLASQKSLPIFKP